MEDSVINVSNDNDLYKLQVQEMKAKVLDLKMQNELLQKEVNQLRRENNQLKRVPLFVAAIVDKLGDGEVYLRQQGNNQEYITRVSPELYDTIKPGMKVAVNNALSIVKTVGTIYDSRVRVMELETAPNITFEQIGGLRGEIEEVREAVEYPLTRPEIFAKVGVEPPKGILLFGPPGTGKTLIAKAVANNAHADFIRMSGAELVHKFIGEGAQLVRELFTFAREHAPSIVFIDEVDAIASQRTNDGTSGSAEVQRTLMQLLAEMDGFDNRGNVRIMAATNRIDILDPAILRPGRFDRIIEIPVPDEDSRREIFRIHTEKMSLAGVDLDALVPLTGGMTGAEIQAICREAGMRAVRRNSDVAENEDFLEAVRKVARKEKPADLRMYI
ncbi:26S proteasome subunit P45 family [Methanofollis liminatans DSM 4140]|uniref:26S proteasome subunit P45 family n=1 Tax=Methanofollis liminatans DSM 4140 TaxID=28892 RepID=J1L367_9EURY|nr:proteasome-activating nucleotidase [Methanofollis liminatans]EJG07165.1 26S proteasome subunit P45 family [Methanofollis liminatans DSM 4140]